MKSCYLFGLVLLVHFSVAQNLFIKNGQWVNCAPQHIQHLAGEKSFKPQQSEYKKWCFLTESYIQLLEEQRLASLQQQNQTENQTSQNTTSDVSNTTQPVQNTTTPSNQTTPAQPVQNATTPSNQTTPAEPVQNATTPSNQTTPVEPVQNTTTPSNQTTPVEPVQNTTTPSNQTTPAQPVQNATTPSNQTTPVEPVQNTTTPSNQTTPVEPVQNATTSSNQTTPVEPVQNATTPSNQTTPVESVQNATTSSNQTTPVEPVQNATTPSNQTTPVEPVQNATTSQTGNQNVTRQNLNNSVLNTLNLDILDNITSQAVQQSQQTYNGTLNDESLKGNLSYVIDDIVSQAEKIANNTQETQIPQVSDEKNRTIDNRTHFHYHYQSNTHTHEFIQTNLGQNISPKDLKNAPYLIFDVLNKTLKFTQASVLPQGNFMFNLPPNVKVIEKYHYHYQWAFHEHTHYMSFLITKSTPWFVEFPWMKDSQPAQFLFTPQNIENLELSQQKTVENLQYNFKPLPFDDPLIFRQFVKGAANQSETKEKKPEQPQKKEYLNIPFKDAGLYKTIQLPLDFNDTLEMPESNSTHYAHIYQFHSHVFNFPQNAETHQPAQVYTRSEQNQVKFSQKPFDSVAQDETEVVVHYHVHQLLHLHLHNIKAAKGFVRQNPSQPQTPRPKYPRVQPYQSPEKPVATPGIFYVPDKVTLKHGPHSKQHFHYLYVEKNFTWGQEYYGDIEQQINLQNINTKTTKSSIKIEDFNFIDREGDQKINSHAHFHYVYTSIFHNHTIGVREKEVPQVVYAFSNCKVLIFSLRSQLLYFSRLRIFLVQRNYQVYSSLSSRIYDIQIFGQKIGQGFVQAKKKKPK